MVLGFVSLLKTLLSSYAMWPCFLVVGHYFIVWSKASSTIGLYLFLTPTEVGSYPIKVERSVAEKVDDLPLVLAFWLQSASFGSHFKTQLEGLGFLSKSLVSILLLNAYLYGSDFFGFGIFWLWEPYKNHYHGKARF